MGEHKNSFSDGKVIRSDDTTLTCEELYMLKKNLSLGEHDMASLRKLQKVSDKIEEAIEPHADAIDHLTKNVQDMLNTEGVNSTEFREANNALIAANKEASASIGGDVILTMTEYDWLKERWKANKNFVGNDEVRAKLFHIDDAVLEAKGVKFVGSSKKVWVEGEPQPMPEPADEATKPNLAVVNE